MNEDRENILIALAEAHAMPDSEEVARWRVSCASALAYWDKHQRYDKRIMKFLIDAKNLRHGSNVLRIAGRGRVSVVPRLHPI